MPDLDLIFSGRQICDREFAVFVGYSVVGVIDNENLTLHPAVNSALHIDWPGLIHQMLVHLPLNGLSNVEEAVVATEELDVMQNGITVLQRDLRVHSHYLNVWRILTFLLVDFCILSGSRHCLSPLDVHHHHNGVFDTATFTDDQLL